MKTPVYLTDPIKGLKNQESIRELFETHADRVYNLLDNSFYIKHLGKLPDGVMEEVSNLLEEDEDITFYV